MLFSSPPEKDSEWSDTGVKGAFRFLNRLWRVFEDNLELINKTGTEYDDDNLGDEVKKLRFSTHHTVWKVLHDIEDRLQFNTAIAAIMEHLNNVIGVGDATELNPDEKSVFTEACLKIPQVLYCFAPHISEELWQMAGKDKILSENGLPIYKTEYLLREEVTYVIQIMGKLRGKVIVPIDATAEEVKHEALANNNVQKHLEGKTIQKIIVVPGKLVSIVAK